MKAALSVSPLLWLRANKIMLVNTGSLIMATGVTSVLGTAYWGFATRNFPIEAVGIANTSVQAMMLLGMLCTLGFSTLLVTELPRKPEQAGTLISTSLLAVGIAGMVIGALFAAVMPFVSSQFRPLGANINDVLIFGLGVSQTAITIVLDQAMIGLLRGEVQFWRNIFFAVAKLLVLSMISLWLSQHDGISIYAAWTIGGLLSLILLLAYALYKKALRGGHWLPRLSLLKNLGLSAVQHHFLNLVLQTPTFLTLLVTGLLSATVTAWFSTAWMIVNVVFLIPSSLTTVLHAMNSAAPWMLARKARLTLGLSMLMCLLTDSVLFIGAPQVLGVFGSSYAANASFCLRILSLAAFPYVIKAHYISICRIQDRLVPAMIGMVPGGILELGVAAIGAHFAGLAGLSLGWTITIYIESIFMIPTVYGALQPKEASQAYAELETEVEAIWRTETALLPAMSQGYMGVGDPLWYTETVITPLVKSIYEMETCKLAAIPVVNQDTGVKIIQRQIDQIKTEKMPAQRNRQIHRLTLPSRPLPQSSLVNDSALQLGNREATNTPKTDPILHSEQIDKHTTKDQIQHKEASLIKPFF